MSRILHDAFDAGGLLSVKFDSSVEKLQRTSGFPSSLRSVSMCTWVRFDNFDAWGGIIGLWNGYDGPGIYFNSDTGYVGFECGTSPFDEDAFIPELDIWYFVGVTVDSSGNMYGYSGSEEDTELVVYDLTTLNQASGTPSTLTMGNDPWGDQLMGQVCYARLWETTLTDEEMNAEFHSATLVKTANAYGAWSLNSTTDLADDSGNSHDFSSSGSISNGAEAPTPPPDTEQDLVQSSRFDNSQTWYTHTLSASIALTQSSQFDNSQTWYTHVLSATISLTQTVIASNSQTWYTHGLASTIGLTQSSRFDNSQTWYTHTLGTSIALTQTSRFDNDQTWYVHVLTQPSTGITLTQDSRFDNAQTWYTQLIEHLGQKPITITVTLSGVNVEVTTTSGGVALSTMEKYTASLSTMAVTESTESNEAIASVELIDAG